MSMWRGPRICSIYSLLLAPRASDAKGCFFAKSLQSQLKAEADAVHCQHRNTCSDLSDPIPLFIGNFNSCRSLNTTFLWIGQELLKSLNHLLPRPPPHYEIFPPHLPAAQKQPCHLRAELGKFLVVAGEDFPWQRSPERCCLLCFCSLSVSLSFHQALHN